VTSRQVEQVLARLHKVKKSGSGWSASCPCRADDDNPSISVGEGADGRALIHCHRGDGCSTDEICKAMGMEIGDLFPPAPAEKPKSSSGPGRLEDTYKYLDEHGRLVMEVLRYRDEDGKKTFRQRRPSEDGTGWSWSTSGIKKPLYRLPEVLEAARNRHIVFVVEGEKDVHSIEREGYVATTNPGGAGGPHQNKWLPDHTASLKGARVIVVADNDEPGLRHAHAVVDELQKAEIPVKLRVAPAPYKDVSEFLGAGGNLTDLQELDRSEPESPDSDLNHEEVSKFSKILTVLQELESRKDMEDAAKLARARGLISAELSEDLTNPGRLVRWTELIEETDDDGYDWLIPGMLERQERVMIVAAEGVGKALALDTPIPTPSGWTTMGELSVGDEVLGGDGKPCRVTFTTPVMTERPCFTVRFTDGTEIVADAEHQWVTQTLNERESRKPAQIRTTAEIAASIRAKRSTRALEHSVATVAPLDLPEVDLPISPYTLGAWLGDGTTLDGAITNEDDGVIERITNDGYEIVHRPSTKNVYGIYGLKVALRGAGLLGAKHIPITYLRASLDQRLDLMRGLMDTDGSIDKRGTCEFSVIHEPLADGFLELCHTLGIKATKRKGPAMLNGIDHGPRYRITFRTDLPVFGLARKAARLPARLPTERGRRRYIEEVEPRESVPVRCIQVDCPSSTYLCGSEMIVTHNTMLARQVAILSGAGVHPFTLGRMKPVRTLFVDLENPERIIRRTSRKILNGVRTAYEKNADPEAMLWVKPDGINILKAADRAALEEKIEKTKPELLVLGPLYKSFVDPGNKTAEATAIEVAMILDEIRTTHGCALWLEHHAPLGNSLSARDLRPMGSAVWMRWPEFGYALAPDPTAVGTDPIYDVKQWRGPRDIRKWPTKMKRSSLFPFEVIEYSS